MEHPVDSDASTEGSGDESEYQPNDKPSATSVRRAVNDVYSLARLGEKKLRKLFRQQTKEFLESLLAVSEQARKKHKDKKIEAILLEKELAEEEDTCESVTLGSQNSIFTSSEEN